MCTHTIIDASVFGKIDSPQMKPFRNWIKDGHGILIYTEGGKYGEELRKRTRRAYDLFVAYRQSGRARLFKWEDQVRGHELALESATFSSDDPHIIALARASDTLVLCTCDAT